MQKWLYKDDDNSFEFIQSFPTQPSLSSFHFFFFLPFSLHQVSRFGASNVVLKKKSSTSSSSSRSSISLEFELERKLKNSLPEITSVLLVCRTFKFYSVGFECFQCKELMAVLYCGLVLILGSKRVLNWRFSSQGQAKQGIFLINLQTRKVYSFLLI